MYTNISTCKWGNRSIYCKWTMSMSPTHSLLSISSGRLLSRVFHFCDNCLKMISISYRNKGNKCKIDNWNWKEVYTYKLSNAGFDTISCCFGLMWNNIEEDFASFLLPRDLNIHKKNYKLLIWYINKIMQIKYVKIQ